MKNFNFINIIKVTTIVLLIGCMNLTTACAPSTAAQIDLVKSIMLKERDTDSLIQYRSSADETMKAKGYMSLHDDLFEYEFHPDGYIVKASRSNIKTSDIYSATSDNQEDLETRALNLHKRNLSMWLNGDNTITRNADPMGTMSFEVTETLNGNPTGRMTYVSFSKGGALIALVSINKPVPKEDLAQKAVISEEGAAEIAFADLLKQYGDVLENRRLSEVQWTAIKEAIQQHLVWTVTINDLTRKDFQTPTQKWSVIYRVDILTGEITQRLHSS